MAATVKTKVDTHIDKAIAESFSVSLLIAAEEILDDVGNPTWSAYAMREIEAACNQIRMIVGNQ